MVSPVLPLFSMCLIVRMFVVWCYHYTKMLKWIAVCVGIIRSYMRWRHSPRRAKTYLRHRKTNRDSDSPIWVIDDTKILFLFHFFVSISITFLRFRGALHGHPGTCRATWQCGWNLGWTTFFVEVICVISGQRLPFLANMWCFGAGGSTGAPHIGIPTIRPWIENWDFVSVMRINKKFLTCRSSKFVEKKWMAPFGKNLTLGLSF